MHISENTVQLIDSIFSYSPDAVEKTFISYGKLTREFIQRSADNPYILSFKRSTEAYKNNINPNDKSSPQIEKNKTQIQELKVQELKVQNKDDDCNGFNDQIPSSKSFQCNVKDQNLKEHDLDQMLVDNAMNSMKSRYRYNYSVLDFTYNLLFPF